MGGINQTPKSDKLANQPLESSEISSQPSTPNELAGQSVETIPKQAAQDLGKLALSHTGDLSDEEIAQFIKEDEEWAREMAAIEQENAELERQLTELDNFEDPELDAWLAQQEKIRKFKPIFVDDINKLLDETDEHDIRSPECPIFLINGENLAELVELTNDPETAEDFQYELTRTIEKRLENEYGQLGPDDESPDEVAGQLLAITLKRAAQEHLDGKLSKE